MHDHGGRLAVTTYPVLFGTRRLEWAPIDLRFELLTGAVDDGQGRSRLRRPIRGGSLRRDRVQER
jgi:hypothetical protein